MGHSSNYGPTGGNPALDNADPTAPAGALGKPLSQWTDEELRNFIPMIGMPSGSSKGNPFGITAAQVTAEITGRQKRNDYVSTALDQPGKKQTLFSAPAQSVLGKPIL